MQKLDKRRLGDAVAEWVKAMRLDLAPATVEGRHTSLRKTVKVLGADKWVHEITPTDMTKVWAHICQTRALNSRGIDHQAQKHFFTFCEDMNARVRFESPFKHIKSPKPHYRERNRIDVEQFEDLKAACISPRDRMYVSEGLYMLCRKVEMYHIRWNDVDRKAGEITFTRHKTGEPEVLAISDELEKELEYYEDWYKFVTDTPRSTALDPRWFLTPAFTKPQYTGGREWVRGLIRPSVKMDRQAGARLVVRALNAIDFPTVDLITGKSSQEGAHTLRRSGARALFDAEVAAGNVKAMRHVMLTLGHATETQTMKYIGAHVDRMERNERIRGKVMYPKARAVLEEKREIERGGLRLIVS